MDSMYSAATWGLSVGEGSDMMGKETFYFPHDYNARTDRKLVNVLMRHGLLGIGLYWCLIEMLYEEGGFLPFEYERISFELHITHDIIKSLICDFELFQFDAEKFWSVSVIERLKERCEKSEKARESINKRWEKYRNTNVIRSYQGRNTRKGSKGKENKGNKYSAEFETFYLAYPKKKAPDKAWEAWKKRNGDRPEIDVILSAVRIQSESTDWTKENGKYIPYPATWLNQGRWADEVDVHGLKKKSDPFKD
jgi:hypothetical protein